MYIADKYINLHKIITEKGAFRSEKPNIG